MTKEREALQALVQEMEYVLTCINANNVPFDGDDFHEALRLGREALAQPEQEPLTENGMYRLGYHNGYGFGEAYGKANAPQRTWVGLTDEEIDAVTDQQWGKKSEPIYAAHRAYARATEAKLNEKNT